MQKTYDPNKQDHKTGLLTKISPTLAGFGGRVHMVKVSKSSGQPHRLLCHDGSWVEIDQDGHLLRTWGEGRTAREIATAIMADDPYFHVEHLEKSAIAAAPGAPRRAAPVLADDELRTMADRWRARGFTDIESADDGVWIALAGGTRLHDIGTRVTIHGPVTDEALAAMVAKAKVEWDGQHWLTGSWTDRDRERMWLESQRQGVMLLHYEPSAELLARWDAEQEATGRTAGQTLRPDDDMTSATAGPMPSMSGSDAEPEPDLAAFDRQSASLDRRQADLEQRQRATHKERSDYFQRTERLDLRAAQARAFEEHEQLRQAEAKIAEAREVLTRARELAIEKDLDYESAIAVAKAEHLAEQENGYRPSAQMRR